jgi:hypothetical protein
MRINQLMTLHKRGQDRVIHFGSLFTVQNMNALLDALAIQDPFAPRADIPAEVQTVVQRDRSRI